MAYDPTNDIWSDGAPALAAAQLGAAFGKRVPIGGDVSTNTTIARNARQARAMSDILGDLALTPGMFVYQGAPYQDRAFADWWGECLAQGATGYIPGGPTSYRFSEPLDLDMSGATSPYGATIRTGGRASTVLDFSAAAGATQPMLFFGNASSPAANFYGELKGLRVVGSVIGCPLVRVGLTNFVDAENSYDLDLIVQNAATDAGASAVEINGSYESRMWVTASMGGLGTSLGTALRLCGPRFCDIMFSGGSAANGLYMTGGQISKNRMMLDVEETVEAIKCDAAYAFGNTLWGQIADCTWGYDFTAGYLNRSFIVPDVPDAQLVKNGTGLILVDPQRITTPASGTPVSGTIYTNGFCQTVGVNLNGSITSITVAGVQAVGTASNAYVVVMPGEAITIVGTGLSWSWKGTQA